MRNPAAIRERVFVEVERLRAVVQNALAPGHPNVFTWMEAELWLDRSRLLVLGRSPAARELNCESSDRVPDALDEP